MTEKTYLKHQGLRLLQCLAVVITILLHLTDEDRSISIITYKVNGATLSQLHLALVFAATHSTLPLSPYYKKLMSAVHVREVL